MKENLTPGEFLRRFRMGKKKTLIGIALGSKKDQAFFSRIEKGTTKITERNINKILTTYEMTEREKQNFQRVLFSGAEVLESHEDKREEMDIFYQLMKLSKEARQRIIRAAIAYDASSNDSETK